jgi:hypothetical protein
MDAKAMTLSALPPVGANAHTLAMAGACLLIGAAIGDLHFRILRWNTRLFVNGGAIWLPVAAQILRLAFTAIALLICARAGLSLPAILIGLLLARRFVLRKEAA